MTDLAGCTNFVVLAAGTLFLSFDLIDNRRIVLTSLVCASRLELAAFLFYRVLKRGKDSRFDVVRERGLVFLVFWVWQMLWVFVVSTPVIYVNAVTLAEVPPIGALDWVGRALVVVGCVLQTVADLHKNAFRSTRRTTRRCATAGSEVLAPPQLLRRGAHLVGRLHRRHPRLRAVARRLRDRRLARLHDVRPPRLHRHPAGGGQGVGPLVRRRRVGGAVRRVLPLDAAADDVPARALRHAARAQAAALLRVPVLRAQGRELGRGGRTWPMARCARRGAILFLQERDYAHHKE